MGTNYGGIEGRRLFLPELEAIVVASASKQKLTGNAGNCGTAL